MFKALFGIALIVVSFMAGFYFENFVDDFKIPFTGKVVDEIEKNYTYTRAVCNSDNECIDLEIRCKNGEVMELRPASELIDYEYIEPNANNSSSFCE